MTAPTAPVWTRSARTGHVSEDVRDERRWTVGAWLTLAAAVTYLVAGVVYVIAAFQQPTEGWNVVYNEPVGWRVTLNQGGGDALHVGDRILAIEGFDVDTALLPPRDPPPGWVIGGTARYTIERDGARLDVDVPLVAIPWQALAAFVFIGIDGTNLAAVVCLVFGFVVFAVRPGNTAARLLLLILTDFMGAIFIWTASNTPTHAYFPWPLYWTFRTTGLFWPVLFAAVAHLTLTFPRPVWPMTRAPRLITSTLYGVACLAWFASLVTHSMAVYGSGLLVLMFTMVVALIGSIVYNLRSPLDAVARAQSAWVALGLGGTFLIVAFSAVLTLIDPAQSSDWSGNLVVLILPLCLGIAILRHRLFDVDVVIRRTLVYSVLAMTLAAGYLIGVAVLQAVFVSVTGAESTLAVVASTLAIAGLFQPARVRVQRAIDRRFFRRTYSAVQILDAFARRAQQDADLDALSRDVVTTVRDALEPDAVTLWLMRGRS